MANFHTHLSVALAVSSSVATAGLMLGFFNFFEMVVLAIIGMIGGLLPDIDLDHSKISQMAFNIASLFGAGFLLFLYHNHRPLNIVDALIYWGFLVFFLKFGVFFLFAKFTRHRGMVHSVPYMAMLALLFALLSHYFLEFSAKNSHLFGAFLFVGAIIHLLLDEIYSVNVYGLKVKRSFGTAFKFFESKKWINYCILYLIIIALCQFLPPTDLWRQLLSPINKKLPPFWFYYHFVL